MLQSALNKVINKSDGSKETVPILSDNREKSHTNYGLEKLSDSGDLERRCDGFGYRPGGQQSSSSYPAGVYFVLCSKFFESFAANGIRSVLALYLRDSLLFSEDFSTMVLHIFNFFSQFCPIFGAILADCFIGNVKAISYFCLVYTAGFVGITLTTIPIMTSEALSSNLVYVSLLLISIGNGSIRANVTSLGAEQFKQPEQSKALQRYFSHYYLFYTAGILLSKTITPSLRRVSKCFNQDSCNFAVFGLLSIMFSCCFAIFLIGTCFYKKRSRNLNENVLVRICGCVFRSVRLRISSPNRGPFLDNCVDKYGLQFISHVKQIFNITKLFLPLPIYWSLLAQQDSSWTFQATKMDTWIFGGVWHIEPDQVKAIGPFVLLLLIPLWTSFKQHLLSRSFIDISPLASVTLGGLAASLSFVCAGFLEIFIKACPAGSVSVLWQLPQFVLLMMGEVLLAIPGLQFAFTQAPSFMKSVLTAFWFINNAFGNLIVVLITEIKPVQKQSMEYFLYSALMLLGIILFAVLAKNYRETPQIEIVS